MSDAATESPSESEQDDSNQCEQPDLEERVPVEGGFTEDVNDAPATCIDPGEATVGVKQRLRLQVPNVYTQLTLGEAVNNVDHQGFSYAGFGAQTAGHVFISAGTPAAPSDAEKDNFMMLHAKSGLSALSPEGSVFVAGRTGVNAVSGGGVTMVGEAGVLIGGGTMGSVFTEDFKHDFDGRTREHVDPSPPDWAVTQGRVVSAIAVGINSIDTAVALANGRMRSTRKAALTPSIDPSEGFAARVASRLDCVGAMASTTGSALDACGTSWPTIMGAPTGVANRASASTVLFGQSGTIISSPLSVAVYAGPAGAVIGSLGCIDLLANDSLHAHSGGTVAVSGAAVSILADGGAELLSKKQCTVASRTAGTIVLGSFVHVGSIASRDGQADTDSACLLGKDVVAMAQQTALLTAKKRVALGSDNAIDAESKSIHLTARETLTVDAETAAIGASKAVKLAVGNGAVIVEEQRLAVGWFDSAFSVPSAADRYEFEKLKAYFESNPDVSKPEVADYIERYAGPRLRDLELKLDKYRTSGMQNGLLVKKSGIEVVYEDLSFSVSRGKAKVGKHLVVSK